MKEPKYKAAELVEKMDGNIEHAKIAVDEILLTCNWSTYVYWQQVRLELDKL